MPRGLLLAIAATVAGALASPLAAGAQVQPYRFGDAGGFRNVLPPGSNGHTDVVELGAFLATGARPRHNADQRDLYASLLTGETRVDRLFKDASFGSPPGAQASAVRPAPGITITRDGDFGVPHVYAASRALAMFGTGWATAADRLFLVDVLRNVGRGRLSAFAGGAPGNRAQDAEQWEHAPYTEADLQRQYDQLDDLYGDEGRQVQQDVAAYVDGINRYIADAALDVTKLPGEYAAIGRPLGPQRWQVGDVIATASLVGGIFGTGGGEELTQMQLRRSFRARYGARRGERLWREWAAFEDRDAPTTVRGRRFPYQAPPRRPARGALAIADPGTLEPVPVVASAARAAPATRARSRAAGERGLLPAGWRRRSMSNALVVSAREAAGGRPLAVFGAQTGYFSPQILIETDVHAPTIQARGAGFAGANLYVQLGRGPDYAWSATSAGQDIVDTFAVALCEPDGRRATLASMHYRFRGACRPIEVLERVNRWAPTLADATPAGSQTLRALRTKLGLVTARARIGGEPVVYTRLRSTYLHEFDSARGFADFNDPAKMRDARDFQRAAAKIGFTFNWLYVDERDIAYFNSGFNPQRAPGVTGQLPVHARHEWRGFDAERSSAAYTSFARHPQAINGQPYLTSWNNKQAPGYAGSDTNLYSSVYRSQLLDEQLDARIAGARRIDLDGVVAAMAQAATTDLRARRVLPLALTVIGRPSEPRLAGAVAQLRAWVAAGGQRRDGDGDGDGRYEHGDAIALLDAFWPLWMRAQFEPSLGAPLFAQLVAAHGLDDEPNSDGDHVGSAYQTGWYGYAAKDLRRLLGRRVAAPYGRRYCGGGVRARCRSALRDALRRALAVDRRTLYRDDVCAQAGRPADQACFDAILFRPTGGVTQPLIGWQNRPTFQQAVEVQGHRTRP